MVRRPLVAARSAATPVIEFLSVFSSAEAEFLVVAFCQGPGEADYVEDRNVAIKYRWAETKYDRFRPFAKG